MRGPLRRHVTFFDAYGHLYGGTQRSAHLLAEHLPRYGYTADVVVTREGPLASRLRASGVDVTVIPVPAALSHYGGQTRGPRIASAAAGLPSYWRQLARHFRARSAIVHGCTQRSVILAAPPARLAGARFLWQVSVAEDHRAVSVLCDALSKRTIGVSASVHVPTVRPWRAQEVIVPPLDPRLEGAAEPAPVDPPLVVTSGRLEPMKVFDLLIRAMVRVRARVPGASLQILGGVQEGHEAYADMLRELCADLSLSDAITFVGYVDRPEDYWRTASVYVQPSHLEGNSVAVFEAMASGIAPIVVSTTGNAEVIEHGQSGMVVPPNDEIALADALIAVLEDRALATRLGTAARLIAKDRYSVDRVAEATAELYERMLGR